MFNGFDAKAIKAQIKVRCGSPNDQHLRHKVFVYSVDQELQVGKQWLHMV